MDIVWCTSARYFKFWKDGSLKSVFVILSPYKHPAWVFNNQNKAIGGALGERLPYVWGYEISRWEIWFRISLLPWGGKLRPKGHGDQSKDCRFKDFLRLNNWQVQVCSLMIWSRTETFLPAQAPQFCKYQKSGWGLGVVRIVPILWYYAGTTSLSPALGGGWEQGDLLQITPEMGHRLFIYSV